MYNPRLRKILKRDTGATRSPNQSNKWKYFPVIKKGVQIKSFTLFQPNSMKRECYWLHFIFISRLKNYTRVCGHTLLHYLLMFISEFQVVSNIYKEIKIPALRLSAIQLPEDRKVESQTNHIFSDMERQKLNHSSFF